MDVIKELGLNVLHVDASKPYEPDIRYEDVVLVSDLRAAIEKLPVVYGAPDKNATWWGNECEKGDTHKARLILVEKLVKEPVKREQIVLMTKDFKFYSQYGEEFGSQFAGKKVKVTFEEVIE